MLDFYCMELREEVLWISGFGEFGCSELFTIRSKNIQSFFFLSYN